MLISKFLAVGQLTGVEEVDLLILSSQWAGIAHVQQEKMEGLRHLERVAQLEEPEDSKSKAHSMMVYFFFPVYILLNMGQKAEALKYLQKVAAYDPSCNVYLEDFENDVDDFAVRLASGRSSFGVSE